jgi:voltage-gated potassium channel
MVSFSAVVDLLAIIPFYLPFLIAVDGRVLRIFRVFRLFRIFGLNRYSNAADLVNKVIKSRRNELLFSFVIIIKLLLVAATLMYFVEHNAQPELFSSIPAAMWWGVATLTTVGYGDMVPITILGKVLAGIMAILGIGIFALPAGILANGFGEEIRRRKLESINASIIGTDKTEKVNEDGVCSQCGKKVNG